MAGKKDYDATTKRKFEIAEENGIKLIAIMPSDNDWRNTISAVVEQGENRPIKPSTTS